MVDPLGTAAAGAVSKSLGKATEDDPDEKAALLKTAEEAGYLAPAAKAMAQRIAVKQQIRLKIWQPLGQLVGIQREYFDTHFNEELAARMADVPEEDVVTPRTSIAAPTIQGISYTVDEPELRRMYLNLLATASDARVQDSAHPSFADVIRQLTTDEAQALTGILGYGSVPIIEIRVPALARDGEVQSGYHVHATNLLNWMKDGQQVDLPERALFVDNWIRLGLINVSFLNSLAREDQYAWVETAPSMVEARRMYDAASSDPPRVTHQRGVLTVTNFGRKFHQVVSATPMSRDPEHTVD